jgi:hypothetical protein
VYNKQEWRDGVCQPPVISGVMSGRRDGAGRCPPVTSGVAAPPAPRPALPLTLRKKKHFAELDFVELNCFSSSFELLLSYPLGGHSTLYLKNLGSVGFGIWRDAATLLLVYCCLD